MKKGSILSSRQLITVDKSQIIERNTSIGGTAGIFTIGSGSSLCYVKLSRIKGYHGGYTNKEPVCEVLCSRLGALLGLESLTYQLVDVIIRDKSDETRTIGCLSEDFAKGREVLSAVDLITGAPNDKSYLQYIQEQISNKEYVKLCQMFIFDFLIGNRDRHGTNILFCVNENQSYSLSPIFDCENSLFNAWVCSPKWTKDIILMDQLINSFLTSQHMNLMLRDISGVCLHSPSEVSFPRLFYGLQYFINPEQVIGTQKYIKVRWKHLVSNGYIDKYPKFVEVKL